VSNRLGDWLDERTGHRRAVHSALEEPVLGGASFVYVMGSVLLFLLILQAVTGALLAFYYSPSATDAWGSVAYIEDQVTLGWFIRGLHHHGASAMVIAAGLHMLQVVVYGAYKRPREVTWWIGVMLLGLILAFALTGYLLPWDQTGYWATKVATGIAGETPMAGQEVQAALQGGNEEALQVFLSVPRFAGFARGALAIVLSDGLERGGPEALTQAMTRLDGLAWSVLWLTPLAADAQFKPNTEALRAIAPMIDRLGNGSSPQAVAREILHFAKGARR
jgi:quinol-cytochrome oxidoreductase complex cytochrome b subunit